MLPLFYSAVAKKVTDGYVPTGGNAGSQDPESPPFTMLLPRDVCASEVKRVVRFPVLPGPNCAFLQ